MGDNLLSITNYYEHLFINRYGIPQTVGFRKIQNQLKKHGMSYKRKDVNKVIELILDINDFHKKAFSELISLTLPKLKFNKKVDKLLND